MGNREVKEKDHQFLDPTLVLPLCMVDIRDQQKPRPDPLPFSFPSAHPLIFHTLCCCCWRTRSEPLEPLRKWVGGLGPVVGWELPSVTCPGLDPPLATGTLNSSLQADLQAQQWKGSWLTTALPCSSRTRPPNPNLPVTEECLRQPCLCAYALPHILMLVGKKRLRKSCQLFYSETKSGAEEATTTTGDKSPTEKA